MTKEVEDYFFEQYQKQNFQVVPGHWPDFETKKDVDDWISMMVGFGKFVEEKFGNEPHAGKCPSCGFHLSFRKENKGTGAIKLRCLECAAETREYETLALAIEAWNRGEVIQGEKLAVY